MARNELSLEQIKLVEGDLVFLIGRRKRLDWYCFQESKSMRIPMSSIGYSWWGVYAYIHIGESGAPDGHLDIFDGNFDDDVGIND